MRYTLSVLTAACLLALGQPAWAEAADGELVQRARHAALALPATDRACASQLLLQLQADMPAPAAPQRALPFHRLCRAIHAVLAQHYASAVSAHLLPHALADYRAGQPALPGATPAMALTLDSTRVQRWMDAWQTAAA